MPRPVYVFDSPAAFAALHGATTRKDFELEKKKIEFWNKKQVIFHAFVMYQFDGSFNRQEWLILVQQDGADGMFPKMGDLCNLKFVTKDKRPRTKWALAEQIENSCGYMGEAFEKLAAFRVTLTNDDASQLKKPMTSDDHDEMPDTWHPKKSTMYVCLELTNSYTTMTAEFEALKKLTSEDRVTEKQWNAFKYLMNFKDPAFRANLFEEIPWMARPVANPHKLPERIVKLYKDFDDDQKQAYKELLMSLPCGVGILPGGPGAGKAHWNLVVSALAQARRIEVLNDQGVSIGTRSVKVLYILDINKPLDNICIKFIKAYRDLGYRKNSMRMGRWKLTGPKVKPNVTVRDWLQMAKLKRRVSMNYRKPDVAPSLDEGQDHSIPRQVIVRASAKYEDVKAAWDLYQEHIKTQYKDLARYTRLALEKRVVKNAEQEKEHQAELHRVLKPFISKLYQDLLSDELVPHSHGVEPQATDFISEPI